MLAFNPDIPNNSYFCFERQNEVQLSLKQEKDTIMNLKLSDVAQS